LVAGEVLVRERYLSFVSTPLDVQGWRKHLELYRAVKERRHEAMVPEGSDCGAWGAALGDIRGANLHAGTEDLARGIRDEICTSNDADAEALVGEVLEDVVYLACVFHQNAFSFPGQDCRRNDVLFPTIARLNHSCTPNAVIVPCKQPQESQLVALRPIAEDETVEICYCPTQYLLRSTEHRRAVLEKKWGFVCHCLRCDLPLEAARCFSLSCSACGAARLLATAARRGLACPACGGDSGAGGDGDCGSGGAAPLAAEGERALDEEAFLEAEVLALAEPEDLELPAASGLASLSAEAAAHWAAFAEAHPEHRLALELWRRHAAELHGAGRVEEATDAQERFVAGALRLLPAGAQGLAWLAELHARLAYLQELAGRPKEQVKETLKQLLGSMAFSMGGRPPPAGMVFDLIECPVWWKMLQRVGPEVF